MYRYTDEQIESAKGLDMHGVARALGLRPGRNGLYYAPWREEQTASLSVHEKNGVWLWRDYGGEDGGTNIDLVMRTRVCKFPQAMEYLLGLDGQPRRQIEEPGDTSARTSTGAGEEKTRIVRVQENRVIRESLREYAAGRGIDRLPGWVRDIEYTRADACGKGKTYYGLAVKNLSGGWDIRSPLGKFKLGKNDVSLVKLGEDNRSVYIVEGMFDGISLQVLPEMKDYDVLILNSAVNRVRAIAALQTYTDVVIVPDHDTGGRETTAYFEHHVALRGKRISIFEYPEACKDVNDYVLLQAGEAGGSLRTEK